MSRAVAIGDERRLRGFALAGVEVMAAADAASVHAAWSALPDDTALVILSADARDYLRDRLAEHVDVIWTVLPE